MGLRRGIGTFRRECATFGLWNALLGLAFRGVRRMFYFTVLRGMYISTVDLEFATVPTGFRAEFLDAAALECAARERKNDLPGAFLDEAQSKGDECYALLHGDELAAYGWYAHVPTRISDDLQVRFDGAYVYMYKGLTLDAYRGQRLHAIGMTRALAAYRARGYKGLVSYVDADNFSSLRSVYRMGYQDFGRVFVLGAFGRYVTFSTPGCRAFGFAVTAEPRNGRGARPVRDMPMRPA